MKKFIKTIALFGAAGTMMMSCAKTDSVNTFTINGTQAGNASEYYVLMTDDSTFKMNELPVDTIKVKDGKFTFSKQLSKPVMGSLVQVDENGEATNLAIEMFFVPGETANIDVTETSYSIEGSKFYQNYNYFKTLVTDIREKAGKIMDKYQSSEMTEDLEQEMDAEFTRLQDSVTNVIMDYAKANNNNEGAIVISMTTIGNVEELLNIATDEVKNGKFKTFFDTLNNRFKEKKESEEKAKQASEATQEGANFVDFEAEYNGKITKLSDYVGKGKYVIVDFWASWCGPCRREIPNLIEIYKKYKSDKFEVLGVATWDEPADTEEAIKELGIEYPQIINAQKAGSDAYGILGIPEIILFAPDGKILRRGLRGTEIEVAVKKALGK